MTRFSTPPKIETRPHFERITLGLRADDCCFVLERGGRGWVAGGGGRGGLGGTGGGGGGGGGLLLTNPPCPNQSRPKVTIEAHESDLVQA